jgi:hypothetical protein
MNPSDSNQERHALPPAPEGAISVPETAMDPHDKASQLPPAEGTTPAPGPAPPPSEGAYASHAKHADRTIHYRLCERTEQLPKERQSFWRRLMKWLTGG